MALQVAAGRDSRQRCSGIAIATHATSDSYCIYRTRGERRVWCSGAVAAENSCKNGTRARHCCGLLYAGTSNCRRSAAAGDTERWSDTRLFDSRDTHCSRFPTICIHSLSQLAVSALSNSNQPWRFVPFKPCNLPPPLHQCVAIVAPSSDPSQPFSALMPMAPNALPTSTTAPTPCLT